MGAELRALLGRRRGRVAVVVVAVLAAAGLELVFPVVVRTAVDDNLVRGRTDGLATAALIYVAAVVGRHGLGAVYGYQAAAVAQQVLHELRVRLFAHACRLPAGYHDRTPVGDTISRATADLDTLQELVTRGVVSLAAEAIPLAAVLVAMVLLSPVLTLIALLVVAPVWLIGRVFRARVRDAQRENRAAIGMLAAHVHEDLGGIDVIRALRRQDHFAQRFDAALDRGLAAFNRANIYNTFYAPLIGLLAAAVTAALLWVGSTAVSVGTVAAFVLLFQRFVQPVTTLGDEWQRVQAALAGAERVFEVLALPVEDPVGPATPAEPSASVEARAVGFAYDAGPPVLHEVDFEVAPGEHVAVVGPTGAGKSTLMDLLVGLRSPGSGTIRVAGVDPVAVPDASRRALIGFVPQAVHLFGGTVRDNLALDNERAAAGDTDLARALARVGMEGTVDLDTSLAGTGGGEGTVLSAGQAQLLALARALVLDPPVVFLDEPTAHVDAATDEVVRRSVHAAVCGRGGTLVTVAHRLAAARDANQVVVLHHGRVVESGPPATLAAAGGLFSALLELEAAGWAARPTRPGPAA